MAPLRRLPQRTCLGCRQAKDKRELVRLVRTAAGSVELDLTGKKAGRGAYLCRNQRCWQEGLQRKRLDHALRTKATPENLQLLTQAAEALIAERTVER